MENDRAMIDDVADLLETTGFHEFSQMIRSDFPEATHGDELPNECTWFPFVMAFVLVGGAVGFWHFGQGIESIQDMVMGKPQNKSKRPTKKY